MLMTIIVVETTAVLVHIQEDLVQIVEHLAVS